MDGLENLAVSFGFFAGVGILWVNLKEFLKANRWLDAHRIHPSYYEDKVREEKIGSGFYAMYYYVGYLGRKSAYRLHPIK